MLRIEKPIKENAVRPASSAVSLLGDENRGNRVWYNVPVVCCQFNQTKLMQHLLKLGARRKAYINLAKRRVRPGSGSSKMLLASRISSGKSPMVLATIFKKTSFVVVGGLATRLYMPERMTQDIDILVLAADRQVCEEELLDAGCKKLGELSIGGVTWALPDGTELDVIFSDEPWAREALAHPIVDENGIPTISLPYLVVMKLYSGRVQDIADITRMLGAANEEQLQQVRQVVAEFMPDALEDIESMIILGKMEYE